MTRIAGVASAFPRQYYRQEQIAKVLKRHWGKELDNPKVLDRLLTRVGVEGRHLALPIEAYQDLTTWGRSNNAWIEVAEELAAQAVCRALKRAPGANLCIHGTQNLQYLRLGKDAAGSFS